MKIKSMAIVEGELHVTTEDEQVYYFRRLALEKLLDMLEKEREMLMELMRSSPPSKTRY